MNINFKKPNRALGVTLVFFLGIFWSTSGVIYRHIEEASPWQVLLYRSLALFFMIFSWLLIKYKLNIFKYFSYSIKQNIIGGFFLGMAFSGYINALEYTSVANAMFILSISPFITALLGILILREKNFWVYVGLYDFYSDRVDYNGWRKNFIR